MLNRAARTTALSGRERGRVEGTPVRAYLSHRRAAYHQHTSGRRGRIRASIDRPSTYDGVELPCLVRTGNVKPKHIECARTQTDTPRERGGVIGAWSVDARAAWTDTTVRARTTGEWTDMRLATRADEHDDTQEHALSTQLETTVRAVTARGEQEDARHRRACP